MWVLFNDHMKDHSNGCTFGGCVSYAMVLQGNWHSDLFGVGLGLYTSNEWPRPLYDNFRDTGSCTIYLQRTDTGYGRIFTRVISKYTAIRSRGR